ncbi:hypothetical protein Bcp1_060 [Bacillus phage Bcp1]|uniref:Uncharacterized protein n=1 Tax=Bacillus phage Bcp1 TaxID=584892 RepID=X2JMQ2_9CAUD|nr:hypothetical protein Bcp1_060 [Bacillus phage Bcp1]AHN66537.1 hypothetical protein Bcp1_060 [Bacillus phage Bcp1]
MFGLTEKELDRYKDLVQTYAIRDLATDVIEDSTLLVDLIVKDGKYYPVPSFLNALVADIEIVLTVNALHTAYDYAHLQTDVNMSEIAIIQHLHNKYENEIINQFIRYGIAFSADVVEEAMTYLIVELPYLYLQAIDNEDFDKDKFLEDRIKAYEDYLFEIGEAGDDEDEEEDEE